MYVYQLWADGTLWCTVLYRQLAEAIALRPDPYRGPVSIRRVWEPCRFK